MKKFKYDILNIKEANKFTTDFGLDFNNFLVKISNDSSKYMRDIDEVGVKALKSAYGKDFNAIYALDYINNHYNISDLLKKLKEFKKEPEYIDLSVK